MTDAMSDFENMKVGDRVRFTVEGEVTYKGKQGRWFDVGGHSYHSHAGTVEVLQKPLAVGDAVTEENVHLLPDLFLLVDRDGTGWAVTPSCSSLRNYSPFKLVYIHPESE